MIKFHNYEINLPNKMNPLFSKVELEKESGIAQTFFLSFFFVYGFKMSIILACIFSFTSNFRKKSLRFKLNEHLKSMFGTKSTSTQTNF